MKAYIIVQYDSTTPQGQNIEIYLNKDKAEQRVYVLNFNKWDDCEYYIDEKEVIE